MTTETIDTKVNVRRKRGGWRRISGILLAVIGLFWLAHQAGWTMVGTGHAAIFLPVVVIAAGLYLFFGSRHRHTT